MSNKKSDEEWGEILSDKLFYVARKKGTQPPFTGKYDNVFDDGVYVCTCCDEPLFSSDTKFPTHCGWPGFAKPISQESVSEHLDNSLDMQRTEIVCSSCDAHLGHMFNDGPKEMGGMRYCINSISLKLIKK